jgi:hypothetical protein
MAHSAWLKEQRKERAARKQKEAIRSVLNQIDRVPKQGRDQLDALLSLVSTSPDVASAAEIAIS